MHLPLSSSSSPSVILTMHQPSSLCIILFITTHQSPASSSSSPISDHHHTQVIIISHQPSSSHITHHHHTSAIITHQPSSSPSVIIIITPSSGSHSFAPPASLCHAACVPVPRRLRASTAAMGCAAITCYWHCGLRANVRSRTVLLSNATCRALSGTLKHSKRIHLASYPMSCRTHTSQGAAPERCV